MSRFNIFKQHGWRNASIVLPGPERKGERFEVRNPLDGEFEAEWLPEGFKARWVCPYLGEIVNVTSWKDNEA